MWGDKIKIEQVYFLCICFHYKRYGLDLLIDFATMHRFLFELFVAEAIHSLANQKILSTYFNGDASTFALYTKPYSPADRMLDMELNSMEGVLVFCMCTESVKRQTKTKIAHELNMMQMSYTFQKYQSILYTFQDQSHITTL